MRLSVIDGDPGYAPYNLIKDKGSVKIFLDDEELRLCYTADEELGMVVKTVVDDKGNIVLTPDGYEVAAEVLYGDVRIIVGEQNELE
jgi:hypothetical protein